MKLCLRLLMPASAFLLVLGTVSAACGGDELTLEEFFRQGQAIDADFEERIEAVYDRLPDDGGETDENLQSNRAFYGEFAVVYEEFVDELETLNPPSEAEAAFDELITAGRAVVEFLREVADRAERADSFADLERLVDESGAASEAVQEPYQAACRSLQEIAGANGFVSVAYLGCSEGF